MEAGSDEQEDLLSTEKDKDEAQGQEDEDADEVEETAEVLMTDMSLEDDMDKIRNSEPGSNWIYHIEAYPWHANDVNEHFIRLMKLASFTNLSMRKKPVCHESEDPERIDDKVMERQRKGSLHLYAESYQTAKCIMRHATWKSMSSKELTFEITKRSLDNDSLIKARLDVDTHSLSKIRFRDKAKGNFNIRTAKVSNLPACITREFLDIVFCRSYPVYSGGAEMEANKEGKEINFQQTLEEVPKFDGSLDIDSLTRASCRAFVHAYKSVFIHGNELCIVANDSQTMVVPPVASAGQKTREEMNKSVTVTAPLDLSVFTGHSMAARGRGVRNPNFIIGRTSSVTRTNTPITHTTQSARVHPLVTIGRTRGMGRGMVSTQQPASVSYTRAGPGMPVPMTGRQKMNEKMRRNHPNIVMGTPNTGIHPVMGASAGFRSASMKSIGDTFKKEIASLQSELERSTQAIEAKIEQLKEESSYYNDYNGEMQMLVEGEWDDGVTYDYDANPDDYFDEAQSDYFAHEYDVQSHDALGYNLKYEQPIEQHVMIPFGRGMPKTRGRGLFQNVSAQRPMPGLIDNLGNVRSSSQMRNTRGRGIRTGFGGGVHYPGPSSVSYW